MRPEKLLAPGTMVRCGQLIGVVIDSYFITDSPSPHFLKASHKVRWEKESVRVYGSIYQVTDLPQPKITIVHGEDIYLYMEKNK